MSAINIEPGLWLKHSEGSANRKKLTSFKIALKEIFYFN